MRLSLFLSLLWILAWGKGFGSVGAVSPESLWEECREEFRRGNYGFVESRTKLFIEKHRYLPPDDRWIFLYISSASDLRAMDILMDRVWIARREHSPVFFRSALLLMERGLVAKSYPLVEKWGFRFRQNAFGHSFYAEGLYIYSSSFYETGRYADANFILNLALKENPGGVLESKILRLKSFLAKENPE